MGYKNGGGKDKNFKGSDIFQSNLCEFQQKWGTVAAMPFFVPTSLLFIGMLCTICKTEHFSDLLSIKNPIWLLLTNTLFYLKIKQ